MKVKERIKKICMTKSARLEDIRIPILSHKKNVDVKNSVLHAYNKFGARLVGAFEEKSERA